MPCLSHPDLPGRCVDTSEARAAVLRKSGWVDCDTEPAAVLLDPTPLVDLVDDDVDN